MQGGIGVVEKGDRLVPSVVTAKPADKSIMEVSTMVRDGDRDVVRKQPFAHVKIALAANHPNAAAKSYPRFNPLKIFSAGDAEAASSVRTGVIYGAEVDSEISLRTIDFPLEAPGHPFAASMSLDEAEETVRTNGSVLTDGTVQFASLNYVDPRRFGSNRLELDFSASLNARVIAENVSIASYSPQAQQRTDYVDDIIPVRKAAALSDILDGAGYTAEQYQAALDMLAQQIKTDEIPTRAVVRVGMEQSGDSTRIIRMSVYQYSSHMITVALSDNNGFVIGNEPPPTPAIRSAFDETQAPVATARDLPNIYDGIYRSALLYGMSADMVSQIIKMLASNVDFQSQLRPSDTLEAFFSVTDDSGIATEDSELLFRQCQIRRKLHPALPVPASRRQFHRLLRRGRPQRAAVPDPQPGAERQVPLRFRHAPSPHPEVLAHAHRRRLVSTKGHADHRIGQRGGREGRLGFGRVRPADDHPPCQWLQVELFAPEQHRQGRGSGGPRASGAGHWHRRLHRTFDRPASPLRADRQRQQGGPDAHPPSRRQVAQGGGICHVCPGT
jgi:hypothetical protein